MPSAFCALAKLSRKVSSETTSSVPVLGWIARGGDSATDHSLQMFRIPFPLNGDLRGGALDLGKVVQRELHVGCSDVFFEAF